MEKPSESIVVISAKVTATIKSYMQRELLSEAKPEVVGKTPSTQAADTQMASIFDGSIYIEPKGRSYYTTGEKLLSKHVSHFFERGKVCRQASKELDKKVCVILGDPGSGKTTFGKHFMRQCFRRWEKNPDQHPIPLWIPLSRLKLGCDRDRSQIYCDLLTYLFKDRMQLSFMEIQSLQQQAMQIFLDSYDEINYMGNLYSDNQWCEWPKAQFVIATRPEKFRSQPYSLAKCLQLYFSPNPNNLYGLSIYTISPLDNELIQEFIKQWVGKSQSTEFAGWDKKHYWQTIEATPNIKLLAANPVMLTMLLHALPELNKRYSDENEYERNRLGQLEIYETFVAIWFTQQAKRILVQLQDYPRLKTIVQKVQLESKEFSIKNCLHAYTENLAYRCLLDSPDDKLGIEITTEQTLLPSLFSQVFGAQTLLKALSNKKTDQDESFCNIWLKLLRSGCLLRCDAHYFAFFHKSLVEYFTQQHLFNDVCKEPEVVVLENAAYKAAKEQGKETAQIAAMNGKLLVKEHNLISMLGKQALTNSAFCNSLYNLVTRSCQDPHFSTAAGIATRRDSNSPNRLLTIHKDSYH